MTQNRSNFADAYRKIYEKLKPSDGAGAYIDDFRKSDAPQFKGKSDKKIQKMAVAAYLDDKDKAKKEDKDMDPRKHVARSKKNPDKFCVFDKDGNEVKLFDTKADAEKYAIANHDKLMEELEEGQKAFIVRYTDPKNKKRFAIPYKDQKSADDKMKQLKRDGVKEIEVTKDVFKRGVKFKEQYELQEAKFAVKLAFLPKPIYMDSESAGKVKMALRKALKKPDDLESVERVMPADYKADLRNRIKGKKDDEDGEEQKEALDKDDVNTIKGVIKGLEKATKLHGKQAATLKKDIQDSLDKKDEPFVKDLIKNLRSGSKTHGKQADDLEKALKTEAANPAQQAAIAISMKKAGKKPKSEMDEGIKPYVSMQRKNGRMNYVVLDKNEKEVYRSTDERLAKNYLRKNFNKLKEMKFDEPEFSKRNFAMNRIGLVAKNLKKKELGKVTDEGRKSKYDMDQDDEEGANKNIIMQLRKSVDLKGRFDVEFEDGKKVKVKDTIARAAVLKHAGMKRPAEKLAFQKKIEKSYRDLLNALKGR